MVRQPALRVLPDSELSEAETPSKLKICQVIATAEGGRWMVEQLRDLRDDYGCEVMAVVGGERGGLVDMLRAERIPCHVEKFYFRSVQIFLLPFTILRLARLFRRERVDVVQSHLFFSIIITRFASWLADVPVRVAMYASPFHLEASTSLWIDRVTWWMESVLIPSCEWTREVFRSMGVRDERQALIYYGPDERRFDPEKIAPANVRGAFGWAPGTPVIAKVAYFYPRLGRSSWIPPASHGRGGKGFGDLVRATPAILAEFPNAKILLVGSGWGDDGLTYLKDIQELVRTMGLEDSVIFAGHRTDANAILADATVAVQASLVENLGGTIEALLMECPTVATRVGGMVDSVRNGETGILVEPSNPADLARGIAELLRDPERSRALGRAGRKLMLERFTLRHTVRELHDLYRRIREQKGRGYNPLVSLWRMIVAVPVFAYLTLRLFFVDMFLLKYFPGRAGSST